MKQSIIILFLAVLVAEVAASSDTLYLKANELYQNGDYEMALESYEAILGSGVESADLYYNMGNASYRSNSIGYAILYFEKALKLDPSHDDAQHNLEFVSRYRVDTFEEVPVLFLRTWFQVLVQSLSEKTWSLLAIVLFLLLLCGILVYLFSQRIGFKKFGFVMALVGLVFFLISIFSATASHRDIIKPEAGIIIAPSVVVRSTPSDSGTELFVLHEGTRVKVQEGIAGWQNIRIIDGREGWIEAIDFKSI